MYTMGADAIGVEGQLAVPAGMTHAIDETGSLLCREGKPRYHFPAREWAIDDGHHLCPMCAAVALERGKPAPAIDWTGSAELAAWSLDL
jgi:hypothetical protein